MDSDARARVVPGDELPSLTFGPISRAQLARYAAASGDFNPIHTDRDFAEAGGHDDVFAHGMLSLGIAGRLVAEWAGANRVRKISGRFTALTHVHDHIVVTGTVVDVDDGEYGRAARIALKTEVEGRTTTIGEALVALGHQ